MKNVERRRHIRHGRPSFYSDTQIHTYMQRIDFPAAGYGDLSSFRSDLTNLKLLVRLHLLAFPFENSRLHYAEAHEVDVSPENVYDRLVQQRHGGSWCCGQNGLLLGMLRGLGYRAYAASGRVNKSPPASKEVTAFTFLTHLVLIVQLDVTTQVPDDVSADATYLVDVGFGGDGPAQPILLRVGQTVPGSAPPEEHRLIRVMHPDSSLEEDDSIQNWVLQHRCGSHHPDWKVLYLFEESETFPSDWIAFSQWLCRHPPEPFLSNVVCVRYFIVEDKDGASENEGRKGIEAPLGRLVMMGKKVQKRVGDQSQTVREFSTERERVHILKEDFGVVVEDSEVQNIASTPAALPTA